ncbi:protein kinase-like protein [Mumia flava]|uniref:Protein kinase-like protein n=1 Tax=Mumia flava TaxID=1348852 RepID=A0A2M9B7L5_9ACTN|nr:protein kinase-like protein [Mumia flava]
MALKVLTLRHPSARERFAAEVDLLRSLGGQGFPAFVDADLAAAPPWFAMELLDGFTLDEIARHAGPLPVPAVAGIGLDVARSLDRLHQHGFAHRDVKPANVMLSARRAMLIDVGIAKGGDDRDLTRTGEIVGSVVWAAPERLTGGAVTPACDVYGLGLLLAFVVGGRRPFPSAPEPETISAVLDGRADLGSVPPPLLDLVRAMTRVAPEDRPSMADVMSALAGIAGRPSDPEPPGAPRPLLVPPTTAGTVAAPAPPPAPAEPALEPAVARLLANERLMSTLRSAHERGYDQAATAIVARAQRRSPRRSVKAVAPGAVRVAAWRESGWTDAEHAERRRFEDTEAGWTSERGLMRRGWWLDKVAAFIALVAAVVCLTASIPQTEDVVRTWFAWVNDLMPDVAVGTRSLPWDLIAIFLLAVAALVWAGLLGERAQAVRGEGWPSTLRLAPSMTAICALLVAVSFAVTAITVLR